MRIKSHSEKFERELAEKEIPLALRKKTGSFCFYS